MGSVLIEGNICISRERERERERESRTEPVVCLLKCLKSQLKRCLWLQPVTLNQEETRS